MGSGQSSSGGDTSNKGSFSVDPSGKISQPRPKVSSQQQQSQTDQTDTSQLGSSDATASQHQRHDGNPPDQNSQDTIGTTSSQLSTLNNLNRTTNDLGLSLEEADELLTRMKAKYKPDAAEEAGRGRCKLDEVERNLAHCYRVNKDRTLACAKLAREYQELVRQQRSEFLQKQSQSDRPIAT